MANTTIKITQLQNIGNGLAGNTLLPVVNTTGTAITQKVTVGNVANFVLGQAGNTLAPAFLSTLAYSVANAAQPNITSVGTLSINTLKISGGTNGYVIQTDGSGNLSWTAQTGNAGNGTPGGSNTQVQFNDSGAFGGNTGFTFNKTTGIFTSPFLAGNGNGLSNIQGANVSGLGNIATANFDGNTSNVLHGDGTWSADQTTYGNSNVVTLLSAFGSNTITTTGNISGGNLVTGGQVVASGNVSSGTGLTTGGFLSVDGNTDLHNTIVTGNLSATGNITASYVLGNGSQLTNIAGANVGGFVPNANVANTAFAVAVANVVGIGNIATLSLSGSTSNVLYGNGVFAAVAGGNANTGNVTFNDINVIGTGNLKLQPDSANASAYLDIFLTAGPDIHIAGNGETVILGTDDYANVAVNVDGNVSIQAGDANGTQTWNFGTDGNTTIPGFITSNNTITIDNQNSGNTADINIYSADNIYLQGKDMPVGADAEGGDINIYGGDGSPDDGTDTSGTGGDIQIYAGGGGDANTFSASSGGTMLLRGGGGGDASVTSQAGDGGYIEITGGYAGSDGGNTALGAAGGYVEIIAGGSTQEGVNGANVTISSGVSGPNALAGSVEISTPISANGPGGTWTFDGNGILTLPANTFAVNYANGTQVSIGGGGNTGNVTFDDNIIMGTGDEFGDAGLYLAPGNASIANSAVQYLRVRGGDAPTHIHLDTGNNAYYDQYFGNDSKYVKLEAGDVGNVVIGTDDATGNLYNWTFTSDGNLILADGNSVIQSIANSSLDPVNPNVSTMVLTPDPGYSTQSLVLDPTAPGHIHLRAPSTNIDEPLANIFLGGEDSSFEVGYYNGAAPNVFIHSGGNTWTFSNDGTTVFPTGNITSNTSLQFTTTFANYRTVEYQTAGVWDLYVEDTTTGPNDAWSWINVTFKDNLIDKPEVFIENQKANDGIAQRWTFDENGNLNFPRDVAGNTDPYLKILGGPSPQILSEDASLAGPANLAIVTDYLNLSGSNGNRIAIYADNGEIGTEANMVLYTNLGDPGNIVSWILDTTGNLTLPDTSSVLANVSITLEANDTGNITGLNLIGDSNANLYAHGNVTIVSDSSNTTATWAFDATGNLTLPGNTFAVNYANGTQVSIGGGGNTGNVTFSDQVVMGTGGNDGTGGLYLAPGNASIANSAVQYLRVRGGDVATHIHLDTGNNEYYDQYFGADSRYVKLEANGNVVINADDYAGNGATWTLDTTGNLTLPNDANIAIYGNTTQFNSCPNGFLGLNTYDAGGNNIARVSISSTDNSVSIGISDPITEIDYNWFFSNGGNLTLPGNLVIAGNTSVFGTNASLLQTTDDRPLLALSSGANGAVSSLWVEDIGNVGTSNIAAVYANPTVGSGIVRIAVGQNGGNAGPNLWDFGTTGILTLPQGSQISETANTSVNITANANTWAFGVDGNLTVPGSLINNTSMILSAPAVFNICTIATAGSGYNTGSSLKATTGGSGTGMTVGIGYGLSNQLTSVNVVNPGTGYVNGDVITVSEGTGGTFVITKYNVLANQTNNNTVQTDFTFANNTVTLPIYGEMATDASMTLTTNLANAGNTSSWIFGDDGNLTIPGTSGGFIKTISNASIGIVAMDNGTNNPAQLLSINVGNGNATSIISAYATNATIQTNASGNINTWQFDNAGNLTLPANTFAINYANGTQVSLGGGNVTWAQLEDKDGNSGPTIIALGQNAGFDGQGNAAIAIGKNAGQGGQGESAITIGEDAGGNTTQGANAVAIGRSAGFDAQGEYSVAIGQNAGSNIQGLQSVAVGLNAGSNTQGNLAVAIGVSAGFTNQGDATVAIGPNAGHDTQSNEAVAIGAFAGNTSQGTSAVAIGSGAGRTSQGNNSIILNATGANLNQTTANTFTVAPVRNDVSNIAEVMFYNNTSKEVTYGNTISVAGNITGAYILGNGSGLTSLPAPTVTPDISSNGDMSIMTYDGVIRSVNYATVEPSSGNIKGGNISATGNISANNFTGNGGTLSNVATKTSGSWTLASGVNTVNISVPLNGTYAIWVNGNIPNGIITYTATAVVTNTNVPVLGSQYAWYYALGNALVLTSIPDQFTGTVGSISTVNTYAGNTANVFTFGITNNSGNTAVVNYGYTKL